MTPNLSAVVWSNLLYEKGIHYEGEIETDSLTGCLTIGSFRDLVSRILKEVVTARDDGAVLYFNIEGFKSYNERYGFERGNDVIIGLSELIAKNFPGCLIARTSGDQYTAFTQDQGAIDKIEEINEHFPAVCMNMPLDLRTGIFRIDGQDVDVTTACDHAKVAADSIKKQYGVHYRYYDHELNQIIVKQRYIIQNIDKAIEQQRIRVYYQPVVRTLTSEVCGVEALARWDDAVYGIMAPDVLISTLEEYHQIHKLDVFIIEQVCRDYNYARSAGIPLVPISFNLSRMDFELCDIYAAIESAVFTNKVPKDMIHIEITESVFTKNPEFIREPIRRFHEAGYQVWMDDFGSGYSSLNILKDYDFDLIKIDMLFLRKFNYRSRQIIATVVDMAKRLGICTLAEGVETKEQLAFLKAVGCEKAQGFLIDRPEPYAMMLDHLKNLGYVFEDYTKRTYYDDLGKVNLLSTRPLEFDLHAGSEELAPENAQGIPMAIYEFHGAQGRFLMTNVAFRDVLKSMGVYSVEAAELALNNSKAPLYSKLRSYAREISQTGETASLDTITNGNYCVIRARCISTFQGGSAYLAMISNLSENFGFTKGSKMNEILPLIYMMYEIVDIIYPDEDRDEPVYFSAENYNNQFGFTSLTDKFRQTARQKIHHDDRQRFLDFVNTADMWDRLDESDNGMLDDYFRMKLKGGSYQWVQMILSIAKNDSKPRVLFCVRDTEEKKLAKYTEPEIGAISPRIVKDLKYLSELKDDIS